jgi:DNA polymerase III alpha subunit
MKDDFVSKRSFLIANVENILENLSSRREAKKNDADDLFGFADSSEPTANIWKKDAENKSKLELLMMEKEILGLYVSGNPLAEFSSLQRKIRNLTGESNLHLVLIEKIKKVFTKANKMMLGIQITTTEEEMEGIVFPKLALELASILADKQIFWIKGNIKEPEQKKKETSDEAEPSEETTTETREFVERKKLIIEDATPFELGILPLVERLQINLTKAERDELANINWKKLLENPHVIELKVEEIKLQRPTNQIVELKLHKNLGMTKIKEIKAKLTKESLPNSVQVEVYVEVKDEWKKVAGQHWLDQTYLSELQL